MIKTCFAFCLVRIQDGTKIDNAEKPLIQCSTLFLGLLNKCQLPFQCGFNQPEPHLSSVGNCQDGCNSGDPRPEAAETVVSVAV